MRWRKKKKKNAINDRQRMCVCVCGDDRHTKVSKNKKVAEKKG